MRKGTRILLALILVWGFSSLRAQSPVQVSEPSLSLRDGKVQIEYDLKNTSRTDKFTIRIEVSLQNGNTVAARSLSGDVGAGVNGGTNKKILWDIEADQVFLDEDIFVEVYALPENPPVAAVQPPEDEEAAREEVVQEQVAQEQVAQEQEPVNDRTLTEPEAEGSTQKEFKRTSLIVQSLVFPGLGLTRLTGNPHWLRGVAAYGCLGASVYLNRSAWNAYQDYLELEDPNQVEDLIDKAYNQQKTAKYLGIAAVGIWVADLAWTVVGTSDMNKGMQLGAAIDPLSGAPMIAVRLRF